MYKGFEKGKTERLKFLFESAVTHSGEDEITFLKKQYIELFGQMDLTVHSKEEDPFIDVEGYHLRKLLNGEIGVHLFYVAHNLPVPINITMEHNGQTIGLQPIKVVRVYDGNATVTDLRTGYSNAMGMTVDELKLLLFGGVENGIYSA